MNVFIGLDVSLASTAICVLGPHLEGYPMTTSFTPLTVAIGDLVPHSANVRSNSPEKVCTCYRLISVRKCARCDDQRK